MHRISIANNRSLALGLFFICLILILFILSIETVFPYFNPISSNLLYNPFTQNIGYLGSSVIPLNPTPYSQSFSYKDYYSPYPYLQSQNSTNASYGSGSITNTANNSVNYTSNSNSYNTGYTPQINNTNAYTTYRTYQPVNAYQTTNYSTLSSSTYQTVPIYSNNNNNLNTQSQSSISQTGTYNQPYIYTGTYVPAGQNGYYSPSQPQNTSIYYPYTTTNTSQYTGYTQNQPNVYLPANPYTSSQATISGYYRPNSNYWPNAEISQPEPPADVDGGYRGEWVSNTASIDGEICIAEIDQFDSQIGGEIKLKEFTIGTSGRTDITGTVNGDIVSLEIDLDGPVLIFEGTVQSNGNIVGSYIVEGSSGSILDEGTLTFNPR